MLTGEWHVPPLETAYLGAWLVAVIWAVVHLVRRRESLGPFRSDYVRFLSEPWKLATWLIAVVMLVVIAPHSGDPTWDTADSILVSITVYACAPYAVAAMVRKLGARVYDLELAAALVLFFVPCWTYDLYIVVRDGVYPPTWSSNLVLSGVIIGLAGAFWNLSADADSDRGAHFAFQDEHWPPAYRTRFWTVLPMAMLLASPVILLSVAFVVITQMGWI